MVIEMIEVEILIDKIARLKELKIIFKERKDIILFFSCDGYIKQFQAQLDELYSKGKVPND